MSSYDEASEGIVRSVTRAGAILALVRDHSDFGTSEIARQLGLHKSTVSRLIRTMAGVGLIEAIPSSDPDRPHFRPGTTFQEHVETCPVKPVRVVERRRLDKMNEYLYEQRLLHKEKTQIKTSVLQELVDVAQFALGHKELVSIGTIEVGYGVQFQDQQESDSNSPMEVAG